MPINLPKHIAEQATAYSIVVNLSTDAEVRAIANAKLKKLIKDYLLSL